MTSNGVKLLIVTQAVDRANPVLGFFHRWIEEFAKHAKSVSVICLFEGEHKLPENVSVFSLGKEKRQSRIRYVLNFYKYLWSLRGEYDAVFVHMNQEYVLLGGLFWRLAGKRIVLWRNHKKGSLSTHLAGRLAHAVCHTSEEAFVSKFKNAVKMPIGIDTDIFKPRWGADPLSILFLGRLDSVKRPEILLQALESLAKANVPFRADIIGDPTPGREQFALELKKRFSSVPNVSWRTAIRNEETVAAYNSHAVYVNLTPSGSFDKTIGEAAASGCIVVAQNDAVREILPQKLFVNGDSSESTAQAIRNALFLSEDERAQITSILRAFIVEKHSLSLLVSRLAEIIKE